MTDKKRRPVFSLLLAGLLVLMALALAACGDSEPRTADQASGSDTSEAATSDTGGESTTGELSASLDGAGATFPEPLYLEWIGEYTNTVQPGVSINYQGIGSGGGIEQFTQQTVDFGASDAPMKDEELQAAQEAWGAEIFHIPTVFGAVSLAYNLEGVDSLQLTPEVLAGIFLGEITNWNAPAIAAANEGTELPDQAIQVVHRSDSSGTTNIFTGYMAQISDTWDSQVGAGKTVEWPVGVGGQGNDGVAAVIQQQSGSIGYVELSYALESGLPVASLQNAAGNFIEPTLDSTAAAAEGVEFPADLRFSVSNSDSPQAYPIVGATWILVASSGYEPDAAAALRDFLTWSLTEGDALARDLNYAPVPQNLEDLALQKVDAITG